MGPRSKSAGDGDLGPTTTECDIIVLFPCCFVTWDFDTLEDTTTECGKPSIAVEDGAYIPYVCEEHNRRK